MPEHLIPFHLQEADTGEYVLQERVRDAQRRGSHLRPEGPSENTD